MLKTVFPEEGYVYQSKHAKKAWKDEEKRLPKPPIKKLSKGLKPSDFLIDTVQYARGAESRGEYVYRKKYLLPLLKAMVAVDETASVWEDSMGNIVVHVGENPWNTLHAGHIDTVHPDDISPFQEVQHFMVKGEILLGLTEIPKNSIPKVATQERWVDGIKMQHSYIKYELEAAPRRCLGADDGCAVAIMLFLINNQVEGTYAFFRGEERGCVGSNFMLDNTETSLDFSLFKRAIEVDRKGEEDIVYKMSPGLTASIPFAEALGAQLGMGHKPSPNGSITDVGHLALAIPECVNVAAGYSRQHTPHEYASTAYLDDLGEAFLQVDWDGLPSARAANAYVLKTTKQHPVYLGEEFESSYNRNAFDGINSDTTVWGDHAEDMTESDIVMFYDVAGPLDAIMFVATNTRWLVEALAALNLTYAELHALAMFGVDGNFDLAEYIAWPEDEEDEDPQTNDDESRSAN